MTQFSTSTLSTDTRLQPIPTRYKDCYFRSRLEARWAVFFDTASIPWEYEQGGVILPNGECYLPDFWMPRWGMFAEIKPTTTGIGRTEKYEILSTLSGTSLLLIVGPPSSGKYTTYLYRPETHEHCVSDIGHVFGYDRRDEDVIWLIGADDCCACPLDQPKTDHERFPVADHRRLGEAYIAASSARFESFL